MSDVILFGKHEGKPLKEVPIVYLRWMANKKAMQWQDAINELNRRNKEKL